MMAGVGRNHGPWWSITDKGCKKERMVLVGYQFYILDVFAEWKYAGNQLAVIRGAAALSSKVMQRITQEMNYSETAFVLTDVARDGGYDVRIFTPAEEVPFAGHPTLGTAWLIQQEIIRRPVEQVVLNLPIGQIPVRFNYREGRPDELWMQQVQPTFGPVFAPAEVAAVLGLRPEQVDARFPCQVVSTGLPFLIVPLLDLAAVRQCRTNTAALLQLLAQTEAKNMLVLRRRLIDQSTISTSESLLIIWASRKILLLAAPMVVWLATWPRIVTSVRRR